MSHRNIVVRSFPRDTESVGNQQCVSVNTASAVAVSPKFAMEDATLGGDAFEHTLGLADPEDCPRFCAIDSRCVGVRWFDKQQTSACGLFFRFKEAEQVKPGELFWMKPGAGRSGPSNVPTPGDRAILTYDEVQKATSPSGTQPSASAHEHRYGVRAYGQVTTASRDIVRHNSKILKAIQLVQPEFTVEDIAVLSGSDSYRLADGREILLLEGCTPHACGGSRYAIAYDPVKNEAVLVTELDANADGYVIHGAADAQLRQLLADYTRRCEMHP